MDSLSGGERQRVWLAGLVAQVAECLLLDEPTSALDIGHPLTVLALLRLLADKGVSLVVVLHDANLAARYCDELVALHSGRLVRRGASQDLMNADALREVYDVAMAIVPHFRSGLPVSIPPVTRRP